MTVAAPCRHLVRTATLALLAVGACADPTAAPDGALRPRGRPSGDHTAAPATVTVAGNLQSETGCAGDWDPTCGATTLSYDANDGVWQRALVIPTGTYEYKAALNGGWDENYGANAQPNGATIGLTLAAPATVKFYYDHATHWITDSRRSVIATAAGSFQSELGCAGDWDPSCLRSWLQDPDGDGVYTLVTNALPAGNYETKVAINEGWDENYGQGGAPNGATIAFAVPAGATMRFTYDPTTHVLTIAEQVAAPTAAQQLAALRAMVGALALDRGTTTSLQAKLTNAQGALDAGATATACSSLADFMAQVRALSGRKIPVAGATTLLDAAAQLRTTLGC